MPPKKKRAPPKKRKYTQKQKQKQKQSVNVKVSTSGGGSGGGTSFIPMPMNQAPQFDVNQLLQGLGAIRPPQIVSASIAGKVAETQTEQPIMSQVRASEQASMGPLQGGIADKTRKEKSDKEKSRSVMGSSTENMKLPAEPMMSGAISEGEKDIASSSIKRRDQQYYRSRGLVPPESQGKGKKTQYEEDIFGRYMPKTSDIRGSSSFEPSAPTKSKVVSMSDLMSSIGSGSAQQTGGGGMSFA